MELIGQYDSPFVRRVAIALQVIEIPYQHNPLSVFSDYAAVHAINPAVKVPTLICDSGMMLQDSTLILEYAERLVPAVLMPEDPGLWLRAQRIIGLAMAANEKAVALVYEHMLRKPEQRSPAWTERVRDQLSGACGAIDKETTEMSPWLSGKTMQLPDITAAVTYRFIREKLAGIFPLANYPHMADLSARAERTVEFRACPYPA